MGKVDHISSQEPMTVRSYGSNFRGRRKRWRDKYFNDEGNKNQGRREGLFEVLGVSTYLNGCVPSHETKRETTAPVGHSRPPPLPLLYADSRSAPAQLVGFDVAFLLLKHTVD